MKRTILILTFALLTSTTGCAAFIDAGFRELSDHGSNARYENKSYLEHVGDSLFEDDDEDCGTTTTVIVHHRG
jgi:hypothetical protein